MLFEVLKNSLRATVETNGGPDADEWPPIRVIVAEGQDDITIKISDEVCPFLPNASRLLIDRHAQGGGIPRKEIPLVWNYAFTTAEAQSVGDDFGGSDFKAPLAGYGYGLPIARLYAQYLGGNLKLISMQGYGALPLLTHFRGIGTNEDFRDGRVSASVEVIGIERASTIGRFRNLACICLANL